MYKILVLEDIATDAELALYELKRAAIPFSHVRVDNEESYVECLKNFHPDIILSDYNLPDFNALQALECLHKENLVIPFILVTGSQSEEIAVECIKKGADDYILKTSLTRLPTAFHNAIRMKQVEKSMQEAERQLRESELHKTVILNTAADSIITIDSAGRIDLFNHAAEKLFGFNAQTIAGKNITLLIPDFFHKEIGHEFISSENHNLPKPKELLGRKRDGSAVHLETTIERVHQGDKIFYVCVIRDITQRKQSEERINFANRELSTFVYRVSHDLKGPISSILGLTNVMNMELKDVPKAIEFNRLIRKSADKLDRTLVELLKVLHVKDAEIEYSEINLRKLTDELVAKMKIDGNEMRVINKIPENLRFYGAEYFFFIILEKILDNAYKFRKTRCYDNYLMIYAHKEHGLLYLLFEDNGIGIGKDIQHKVFDMFYRGNTISTGSGLGLYLVKSIVEKLNGSIELHSDEGSGTLIKITLPEADPGHPGQVPDKK